MLSPEERRQVIKESNAAAFECDRRAERFAATVDRCNAIVERLSNSKPKSAIQYLAVRDAMIRLNGKANYFTRGFSKLIEAGEAHRQNVTDAIAFQIDATVEPTGVS